MFTIDRTALRYCHGLEFAGTRCEVLTNSPALGPTLSAWRADVTKECPTAFSMQIVTNDDSCGRVGRPHFRGLHHIVIASFGAGNIFVFDLLRRSVTATISEESAGNQNFWDEVLLPIAMGVLGATVGVVPVHCACLSYHGDGLLIAGVSGVGKSTLSAALAHAGLDYISDDWTFLCKRDDRLFAHGISPVVKLLPDAIRHFPNLGQHHVRTSFNGELAYEVKMADAFGASVSRQCKPRWFVFLERSSIAESEFTPISTRRAREYIEASVERLPGQLAAAERIRARVIGQMSRLSCWTFRYSGTPQFAAQEIQAFLCRQNQEAPA
jgi:hypothetical protein